MSLVRFYTESDDNFGCVTSAAGWNHYFGYKEQKAYLFSTTNRDTKLEIGHQT